MAEEPETLGDRLKRLETTVWNLSVDIKHARASEALFDDMLEEVLMPAILLLAGHGHRERLSSMLLRAEEAHATHKHLDEQLRDGACDLLRGWREWIDKLPEWEAPMLPDRHPDVFP